MVRALPEDGNRYEVVDGELLVTPSPRAVHQIAIVALLQFLVPFVRRHKVGTAMVSPADIEFSPRRLVQPDVFVAPLVNGRAAREWAHIRSLLLAIEVLSPSSALADRQVKRRLYQAEQVPEYWLVDLDARLVERWRPDDARPEILAGDIAWAPEGPPEALVISLPAFFREVLDD